MHFSIYTFSPSHITGYIKKSIKISYPLLYTLLVYMLNND